MSTTYSPSIVTRGLVFYLDAANPKSLPSNSTSSWVDLSSNRRICTFTNLSGSNYGDNFATATGSVTAIVMNTGSRAFGVINPNVSYANLGILTNGYTFESVVSLSGYATNARAQGSLILGAVGSTAGLQASSIVDNRYSFIVFYNDTGSGFAGIQAASTAQIQSGSWYHLTGVVSAVVSASMVVDMYINGVQVGTNSANSGSGFASLRDGGLTVGGTNTLLGTSPNQYEYQPWNGAIALARIYNRPLAPTEVLQNFNVTRGRFKL